MSRLFGVLGCMIVLAAMFEGSAAQTTHIVLDDMGWIIPIPGGAGVYTAWAAGKTFMVGDVLTFNFTTGQHDVVEVSRAAFDSCTPTSIIGPIIINGPANVTLNSTGEHYYICTVGPHCSMGQKLAINVTGPPPPTEAPTASPPSQSPTPSAAGPTTSTVGSPQSSLAPTAGSPPPSLAPTGGPTPSGAPPQSSGPTASTEYPPPPSTPTEGPTTSTPPQTTGPPAGGPTTTTTTSPPSPPNSASVAVTASRFVASGSVILVALSLVI